MTWSRTRLKYLFEPERNGVWGEEPDGGEDDILCVRVADFDRTKFIAGPGAETIRSVPPSQLRTRLLHRGDVLLEKSGGTGDKPVGCAVNYDLGVPAVCSNFIAALRPLAGNHPRFVGLLMASLYQNRQNEPFVKQTTGIQNLDSSAYLASWVSVPSFEEQCHIVDFLVRETGKLDAMISEQEHLIELMWERRNAAVFSAITGQEIAGPRKRGVAWVDSIPASWAAVKLLHKAQLGTGHTPSRSRPELWMDCTIPWITTGEVWQVRSDENEVITETREAISQRGVDESSAVVHPAWTVVLSRTASAGFSAIMGGDMATSQDFVTWTCGPELLPHYLLYCLRAMRKDLLERLAMGSTHQTIYMPEIKSITIPLPPVADQQAIVSSLQEVFALLDSIRAELETQTELLRERRHALVTAAVTGQLTSIRDAAG